MMRKVEKGTIGREEGEYYFLAHKGKRHVGGYSEATKKRNQEKKVQSREKFATFRRKKGGREKERYLRNCGKSRSNYRKEKIFLSRRRMLQRLGERKGQRGRKHSLDDVKYSMKKGTNAQINKKRKDRTGKKGHEP